MAPDVRIARDLNPHAASAPLLETPMVEIERLSLWYGPKQALKDISMSIAKQRITAYIGPSGCGKSTLLRCLNRMNDLVDGVRIAGQVRTRANIGDDAIAPAQCAIEDFPVAILGVQRGERSAEQQAIPARVVCMSHVPILAAPSGHHVAAPSQRWPR